MAESAVTPPRRNTPMRRLLGVAYAIDTLTEWLGKAASLIVPTLILIGFVNVVLRYVGFYIGQRLTSNVIIELQWYMFSLLFFFIFAYILKHNVNVRVDFLYANWSPKRRAMVDFIGTLLFLIPFCLLGIYASIDPVLRSWGRQFDGTWGMWELSPDSEGLPRAPIKSMIIVAFVLLLLQAIAQLIKYAAVLSGSLSGPEAARLEEYQAEGVE